MIGVPKVSAEEANRVVHNELRIVNMDNTKNSLYTLSEEAITVAMLGRNFKQTSSKFTVMVTMSGFPELKPVDPQGQPTSYGELEEFGMRVKIEKFSSVFSTLDIDRRSLDNAGRMVQVMDGIRDVALDAYIDNLSYTMNHSHDGEFRVMNGEYASMTDRGKNSIWSEELEDGTIQNNAHNMGSNEFSSAGIKAARKAIRSHKTPYRTRIKSTVLGAIVDRNALDDAKDVVGSINQGVSRTNMIASFGLPLGVLDFSNEKDWYLITDKAQIGFAYYPGFMFPQYSRYLESVSNNDQIVTDWFKKGYIARPTGYFYNKFGK